MKNNQKGYIDGDILFGLGFIILVPLLIFAVLFIRFQASNETVSGIVYNTTNNRFISDATCFSVRAGENTPVTDENKSSYCLPPNSEYKDLINKAAQDKRIKVVVTADKYFSIQLPWTVYPNIKVSEVK